MTANAMKGDRDRCIASGMNDYLAKPVALQNLADILAFWLLSGNGSDITETQRFHDKPRTYAQKVFDEADMLERLEDCAFVRSILEASLLEIPELLGELQQLCKGDDCLVIRRQAHTLKGMAANISAFALRDSAMRVETAAKEGSIESVLELLPEVEQQALLTIEAITKSVNYDP
jgi:HPt (histidine-containing phosphotransfer) domain-containing protein